MPRDRSGSTSTTTADSSWAHRLLLAADDPTDEIGAAWGVKELLRRRLAAPTAHEARHRLFRFFDAVLVADLPETTRLAETLPGLEGRRKLPATRRGTAGPPLPQP